MKKSLLPILLFMMFIPFVVNAETCDTDKISISSIAIDNKSDKVEELDEATASGRSLNLNLSMSEVGDYIKYKIIVKNDSKKDYELDKISLNLNSDYINYSFETEGNSNILKGNSSKNVTLKVEYKKEVPNNKFEGDSYNDNNTMKVQLFSGEKVLKNPNTGVKSYILIMFILLLISGSIYVLLKKKSYSKFMILIIGTTIIIPISVFALCKCDITVNSKVKINKKFVCKSFSEDSWDAISYNVKNGNDACYNIGDTKEVELNGYGTHIVRIANKLTPGECNQEGFSQTACGFIVEFSDIITEYLMNPFEATDTELGKGNIGGWKETKMRHFVNTDIYNSLPNDLKEKILEIKVISGRGSKDTENIISYDKLYLLSTKELWGKDGEQYSIKYDTAEDETRQLDYYKQLNVRTDNVAGAIKKYNNVDYVWWLRTAYGYHWYMFYGVFDDGYEDAEFSRLLGGVSPAFRIG